MKTQPIRCLFAVITLTIAPVCAKAQTSTYTYPLSPTDWSHNFQIQQFNQSQGILTSVNLTLIETASFSWTLANFSPSAASFSLSANSQLTLSLPDSQPPLTTGIGYSVSAPVLLASGDRLTLGSGNLSGFGSFTLSSANYDLSPFVGTATLMLPASTFTTDDSHSTGGNHSEILQTLAGATLVVTYNFTSVPEPSLAALLLPGLGLALWGGFRQRRRAPIHAPTLR